MGTLTSVRVPTVSSTDGDDLAKSAGFYPLAGLVVALAPALLIGVLPFSANVTSALALVAWVVLTGALHLDGWADCCDAALAPWRGGVDVSPEEQYRWRLSVLKDPHVGSFGVIGIVLLLITKWALLTALAGRSSLAITIAAIITAAIMSRLSVVTLLRRFPPASSQGLVAAFGNRIPLLFPFTLAILISVIVAGWAGVIVTMLIGAAFALVMTNLLASWLKGKFGGINGDVCGAAIELGEVVVLLCFVAAQ